MKLVPLSLNRSHSNKVIMKKQTISTGIYKHLFLSMQALALLEAKHSNKHQFEMQEPATQVLIKIIPHKRLSIEMNSI